MTEQILGAEIKIDDKGSSSIDRFEKSVKRLENQMKKLQNQMSKSEKAMATDITKGTSKAESSLNKLANTSQRTASKMKSAFNGVGGHISKLGGFIGGVTSKLAKLTAGVTALGAAGASYAFYQTLKGGSDLEQYGVSMKHFIGIQNKKMNQAQVDAATDNYVKQLRDYANLTPFETGDIMAGGNRMLQITGGNTKSANKFLKIAGDMAALTPGKTVMDAVEALADAKMGEFERMKEFGVKVTAEEFKGLVGKGKTDTLTDKETEKAFAMVLEGKVNSIVKGGAEKLSQTATGKWSTFTGTIQSSFADMGLKTLEKLNKNGGMDKLVKLADRFANALDGVSDSAATLANKLFDKLLDKGEGAMTGLERIFKGFSSDVESWINGDKTFGEIAGEWMSKGVDSVVTLLEQNIPKFVDVGLKFAAAVWQGVEDGLATRKAAFYEEQKNKKGNTWLDNKAIEMVEKTPIIGDLMSGILGPKKKKAVGGKIPHDNYPALLHEGERVVTKQQVNTEEKFGKKQTKTLITGNNFYIREEADIFKVAKELCNQMGY